MKSDLVLIIQKLIEDVTFFESEPRGDCIRDNCRQALSSEATERSRRRGSRSGRDGLCGVAAVIASGALELSFERSYMS